MLAIVGPWAAPAKADPAFPHIVNRLIDHALDRHQRHGVHRNYRPYQRLHRDRVHGRYARHGYRYQPTPDERALRGLSRPGYDINEVLRYNRSNHRR